MISKIIILSLLLFCNYISFVQDNTLLAIDSTKIDAKLIIGFWESVDSNKYRIEFIDEQWAVKLKADVGVAGGYFFSKDSLGMMLFSGWAPNWPPFDCSLYFISPDTLQLSTWFLGSDVVRRKYVRWSE